MLKGIQCQAYQSLSPTFTQVHKTRFIRHVADHMDQPQINVDSRYITKWNL